MHKPVVMGAALGLLVLALMAGGLWMAGNPSRTNASLEHRPVRSDPVAPQNGAVSAPSAMVLAASQPRSSQASQERRKRLAEVRAEFNALRAQGAKAPPEKMRAIVDELEALSPPGFDPRYFQTLRTMLETSARIQTLNDELQALSKSTAPTNAARREEILAEMRMLGEQVSKEARNLQSYAPMPPTPVKSP